MKYAFNLLKDIVTRFRNSYDSHRFIFNNISKRSKALGRVPTQLLPPTLILGGLVTCELLVSCVRYKLVN